MSYEKLQQFKAALQSAVSTYIQKQSTIDEPLVKYRVLFDIEQMQDSFILDQEEQTCFKEGLMDYLPPLTINLQSMPEWKQQHIHILLTQLMESETGCGLWQVTQQELNRIPWWSFFSDIHSLTSDLNNILNQYKPEFLKHEDDQWIKASLESLRQKINELYEKIKSLTSQCDLFKEENIRLREELDKRGVGHDDVIRIVKEKTKEILKEKEELFEELERLRKNHERIIKRKDEVKGCVQNLLTENEELTAKNYTLSQQITSLLEDLEIKSFDAESTIDSIKDQSTQFIEKPVSHTQINQQYMKYRQRSGTSKPSSLSPSLSFWSRKNRGNPQEETPTSTTQLHESFG